MTQRMGRISRKGAKARRQTQSNAIGALSLFLFLPFSALRSSFALCAFAREINTNRRTMPTLTDDLRRQILAVLPKYPSKQAATLPALHIVHDAHRAVSPEAIVEIAEILELHPAEVYDTMTFYGFFRDRRIRKGDKRVWVCRSISCMLRGGEELLADLSRRWNVQPRPHDPRRPAVARVRRMPRRLRRRSVHPGERGMPHEYDRRNRRFRGGKVLIRISRKGAKAQRKYAKKK